MNERKIMKYEKFKEKLSLDFMEYLPERYKDSTIKIVSIPKINRCKEALTVSPKDKPSITPNIYLDDLYEMYQDGKPYQEVMKWAVNFYEEGMKHAHNVSNYIKYEDARENVIMNLINSRENEELLEDIPHRDFLDLSVIYRWVISMSDESIDSTIITNSLMRELGLEEDELYDLAVENTPRLLPNKIMELSQEFMVITNEKGINGATAILYGDILHEIATKMKSDFYLLPSSIHEFISIPKGERKYEELRKIVLEANQTVVKANEILSYNVYLYEQEKGKVCIGKDE